MVQWNPGLLTGIKRGQQDDRGQSTHSDFSSISDGRALLQYDRVAGNAVNLDIRLVAEM